jgi:hypothetical protein
LIASKRDDRAFDADDAGAAVENHRDLVAQIVLDMVRRRRRHVSEPIGRRRGDTRAERIEQRARDRVLRHPHAHAVLPAGHDIQHLCGARQNQCERTWPEGVGELARIGGNLARPLLDCFRAAYMDDHRMIGGPALRREDSAYRRAVRCIGAQPVDGLRRKRDEHPVAEQRHGFSQRGGVGGDDDVTHDDIDMPVRPRVGP